MTNNITGLCVHPNGTVTEVTAPKGDAIDAVSNTLGGATVQAVDGHVFEYDVTFLMDEDAKRKMHARNDYATSVMLDGVLASTLAIVRPGPWWSSVDVGPRTPPCILR
jgi:hypothetical protein